MSLKVRQSKIQVWPQKLDVLNRVSTHMFFSWGKMARLRTIVLIFVIQALPWISAETSGNSEQPSPLERQCSQIKPKLFGHVDNMVEQVSFEIFFFRCFIFRKFFSES